MSKKTIATKNPRSVAVKSSNIFPVDKDGQIIEGNYSTAVGDVKIKKIKPATKYDVINVARSMHDDKFAPKLKELFDPEQEACEESLKSGLYISYRPSDGPYNKQDCIRISSKGRCFCGHLLKEHEEFTGHEPILKCLQSGCICKAFAWVPSRPEESGEFWLRKRRDFVPEEYRAKCRCKHSHEQHKPYPPPYRCTERGCGCSMFQSAFVCAACDQHWHQHQTVLETEAERRRAGRPVGKDWLPFAEMPKLRDMAITGKDDATVTCLNDANPFDKKHGIQDNNKSNFKPTYD